MIRFAGNRTATAVLCLAQFVVVLDATIVATALPAIGADLHLPASRLSWVVTCYTVVMAGLLILGGRVSDLLGARRAFRGGVALFALASLGCALAPSAPVLLATRSVQGVGAALLAPAALAALRALPTSGAGPVGWWTAAGAGGGASGWVLGGLVTQLVGWQWVFAVNVPIGLLTVLASGCLPAPAARKGTVLDLRGAVLVTTGIAAGALGLSLVATHPQRPPGWILLVIGGLALSGFVRQERRCSSPLVPGSLLRRPGVLGGNLTAAAITGSSTPTMLTSILYVQDTLRLSPARASLLYPAFNVAVVAGSLAGPRAVDRLGARSTLVLGFAGIVAGIALLLTLPDHGRPVATLLSGFAVMGAGLGLASVASTTAGTAAVPADQGGVAAGLLGSTAQLGTSLGLAVTSALVASAAAPMVGYRSAFVAAASIAVLGAVGAIRTVSDAVDPEPVREAARS